METVENIVISEIQQNDSSSYLMVISPYTPYDSPTEPILYKATGTQVIAKLKEIFMYDEEETESIEEFLSIIDSMNGDGYDYIQVFMN